MTMEQNEMLKSCYKKKLGVVQLTSECVLKTENENGIAKVLCVSAKPYLESYQAQMGEISFDASVCFNVVYNEETGEICNLRCNGDADGKLESELINLDTLAVMNICVVDTTIKSVSTNEIVVSAILEVSADAFFTEKFEQFENDEDMVVKKEPFKCTNINNFGVGSIKLNDEFDVKDKIEKIVSTTAQVFVKDVKSGTDYFTVNGNVLLNVIYETENKEFRNILKSINFMEEVEASGVSKDCVVDIVAQINNCIIKIDYKNEENQSEITYDIPIFINYVAFCEDEKEIMVDAYSTETNCNLKLESVLKSDKYFNFTSEQKIETIISVDDDKMSLNKALGIGAENVNITKSFAQNGEIVVEGIVYANVICEQDDELNTLASIQAEVPFSFLIKNEHVNEGDEIDVKVVIDDVNVRTKRGKDVDMEIELNIFANVFNTKQDAILTGIECGEAFIINDSTLQIMFANKDETLWQVAKNAKVKPEIIMEQNPDLTFPLQQNSKIILYKQK